MVKKALQTIMIDELMVEYSYPEGLRPAYLRGFHKADSGLYVALQSVFYALGWRLADKRKKSLVKNLRLRLSPVDFKFWKVNGKANRVVTPAFCRALAEYSHPKYRKHFEPMLKDLENFHRISVKFDKEVLK